MHPQSFIQTAAMMMAVAPPAMEARDPIESTPLEAQRMAKPIPGKKFNRWKGAKKRGRK